MEDSSALAYSRRLMNTRADKKADASRATSPRADQCPPSLDDPEAIYRAHVGAVLGFLQAGFSFVREGGERGFFQVRSAFDAEEITHDAFAAFFKQYDSGGYDRTRPPLPYLLRIAANAALRAGRKTAGAVFVDEIPEAVAPEPEDAELKALLVDFYAGLPADDQAVFDAVMAAEQSQANAGAQLGRTRDQVYRAVVRIRRKALGFFGEKGWLDEP